MEGRPSSESCVRYTCMEEGKGPKSASTIVQFQGAAGTPEIPAGKDIFSAGVRSSGSVACLAGSPVFLAGGPLCACNVPVCAPQRKIDTRIRRCQCLFMLLI